MLFSFVVVYKLWDCGGVTKLFVVENMLCRKCAMTAAHDDVEVQPMGGDTPPQGWWKKEYNPYAAGGALGLSSDLACFL